jgi:hypothetical protein
MGVRVTVSGTPSLNTCSSATKTRSPVFVNRSTETFTKNPFLIRTSAPPPKNLPAACPRIASNVFCAVNCE